jgi:hypothetical protein
VDLLEAACDLGIFWSLMTTPYQFNILKDLIRADLYAESGAQARGMSCLVGLGLWEGEFEGVPRQWLRWCDQDGEWLLLDTERERLAKERERLAKEQERVAKEQLQNQLLQAARTLLSRGISLTDVVNMLGLSNDQIQQLTSGSESNSDSQP